MRKRSIYSAIGLLLAGLLATTAEAVPAFARQTGMSCASCHSINYPALNSFGRVFRASGYTMRGSANLIEGEGISLPAELKASLIYKLRYQLAGDVDGNRGEVQWPDEAALLIGGRAAEDIGFLLEAGLGPQDGEGEADKLGNVEVATGGNFLSFKTHFNITNNMAVVLFGTDGLGVGYGMELMNTGVQRSQRPIENRTGFSAAQRLGTASGEATGLAFVYHTGNLMVNYSHWAPTWGNVNANVVGGMAHYLRTNYFIHANGWDLGIGANWMGGTVKVGANAEDDADSDYGEVKVAGQGVDFQALGEVAGKPTEFYFSYGVAPDGDGQTYNETADTRTGFGLLGKMAFTPKLSGYLAHASADMNNAGKDESDSDTTLGLQYMPALNFKFELYHVSNSGDDDADDYTMLMLFAGV